MYAVCQIVMIVNRRVNSMNKKAYIRWSKTEYVGTIRATNENSVEIYSVRYSLNARVQGMTPDLIKNKFAELYDYLFDNGYEVLAGGE